MSKELQTKVKVDQHQLTMRVGRIINQLAISMSVIADAEVRSRTNYSMYASAATQVDQGNRLSYNKLRESRSGTIWGGGYKPPPKGTARKRYIVEWNPNMMPGVTTLSVWLGTAWHEMGHILWSPMETIGVPTTGFNLLEDARTEALMIGTYPKTKPALQACLAHQLELSDLDTNSYGQPNDLKDNPNNMTFQYAWVAGRSHIPKDIRVKFRGLIDSDIAKQIESIYQKYIAMGTNWDKTVAMPLVTELDKLLGTASHTCKTPEYLRGGASQGADGTVSQGSIDDLNLDGEIDDTGSGTGKTNEEGMKAANDIRKGAASSLKQVVDNDEDLAKEIADFEQVLRSHSHNEADLDQANNDTLSPTGKVVSSAREVRRLAAKFNDDSGKGLVRRRDHGRLKPIRYERTMDIDTAYDMWEPGLEQEMYVSLLIDVSGSMSGAHYNEVVYALEVGLDDVAEVDTVYFSDSHFVRPQKNTPYSMNRVVARGGTGPSGGMGYLYSKLQSKHQANKIVVLYTDGAFNSPTEYELVGAYVDELIKQGVTVKLVANRSGDGPLRNLMDKGYATRLRESNFHTVTVIDDLPNVVLEWTRSVLMKPTGGW